MLSMFTKKNLAFVCLVLLVVGCNKNISSTGTVKFSDGEAVTTGFVFFSNGQMAGRGDIQPDGTFTIGMLKPGDGLPVGKYKVYVSGGAADTSAGPDGIPFIDPKYSDYNTTPLTFEVVAGKPASFDIVVERNPAVKK